MYISLRGIICRQKLKVEASVKKKKKKSKLRLDCGLFAESNFMEFCIIKYYVYTFKDIW